MPRRKTKDFDRPIAPDPKYSSKLVAKFINCIMWDGKKNVARKIMYKAMEDAAKRLKQEDPLKMLEQIVENVKPILEVKSRRVGGANYQVPVEVRPKRQLSLAIKWIIGAARNRGPRPMAKKLADEFVDAFNKQGGAIKKREDTHRMAEANKAFAHLRW